MKTLLIIAAIMAASIVGFFAVVGVACLYMTTPMVTQAPNDEDMANYVRSHCDDINVHENAYTHDMDTVCEIRLDTDFIGAVEQSDAISRAILNHQRNTNPQLTQDGKELQ